MKDFLPCFCGCDAELQFDGGWIFECYECGLKSCPAFTPQAARKAFRILLASLEEDE